MNVPLLREIQANIRRVPDQFYMGTWYSPKGTFTGYVIDTHRNPLDDPGMEACIGGWAVAIAGNPAEAGVSAGKMLRQARELLDLPEDRNILFHQTDWPEQFVHYGMPKVEAAERACAFIDWYIEKYSPKPVEVASVEVTANL